MPVLLSLVVPAFGLLVMLLRWRRRWGPQRRVLRNGEPAEATVLSCNDLKTSYAGGKRRAHFETLTSLVLEVRREGQTPYRALCEQWFEGSASSRTVLENSIVPVRIDRTNPQNVFVDIDAKRRSEHAARDAEREQKAKRQDALMKGEAPSSSVEPRA